ncbi:MAG TPA: hypothetical protein P5555_20055 [Candidatus Paceibacterota bacterium]|nr:hypothetical protein [Verrucomicrobiota bacterium]HRZ47477.1 hypothetical protein [Candidatus Paceibacterota bacterium]
MKIGDRFTVLAIGGSSIQRREADLGGTAPRPGVRRPLLLARF